MVFKFKSQRFSIGWFLNQLKINSVALISLVIALSGFTYNVWRDHQNAINDNMRDAAFLVLNDLGELQTIVNHAHFEHDSDRGNPIEGWKHAVMIRDVSHLLGQNAALAGEALYNDWQNNWERLGKDESAEANISNRILQTRQAVLKNINHIQ